MVPTKVMGSGLVVQIVWHLQWCFPVELREVQWKASPVQCAQSSAECQQGASGQREVQYRIARADQASHEAAPGCIIHCRAWKRYRVEQVFEVSSEHGDRPVLRELAFGPTMVRHTAGDRSKASKAQTNCRQKDEASRTAGGAGSPGARHGRINCSFSLCLEVRTEAPNSVFQVDDGLAQSSGLVKSLL